VHQVGFIYKIIFLYSCTKMSPWGWPKCPPKHVGGNFVNKLHHAYWSAFFFVIYM